MIAGILDRSYDYIERTMSGLDDAYNIDDLARRARRRLPAGIYEYVDRGAEDEVTMRENGACIKQLFFRQRVGVDVSLRDISTTLFGVKQSMPVVIGVTGLTHMVCYDGERKLARAAAAAGIPYTIGTTNSASQSDLKPICGDLLWRQIYPPKNRDLLEYHISSARAAGIRVLVLTLDSAVTGNREYLRRGGFVPGNVTARAWMQMLGAPHWLCGTLLRHLMHGGLPGMNNMPEGQTSFYGGAWAANADDFSWDELRTLRKRWGDVLVVKGLSTAEDARIAAECGVDGIIVSNHGGRSLDGCIPSIKALPEIVDAVAPKVTVMVDGGFKRGADILKAIAMGASSVMIGRASLYGLAAGGEAGAARALAILHEEIDRVIALVGCRALADLGRHHLQWVEYQSTSAGPRGDTVDSSK
jgi:(S)-mandelate dehydrogenase